MNKTARVKSQGQNDKNLPAFFFLGKVKHFGQIDYFVSNTGTDKAANALGLQPIQCEVAKHVAEGGLELSHLAIPLYCFEEYGATNT